ncbi:MAG: putative permease, YjgP/YjgQ family [Gammaproteobacteria bacterium]|jgi:lipopolysaccharide export system permease protein|nr:putative permease, YjgP/YjgQ family [Gammaproteobacteria bacterium]
MWKLMRYILTTVLLAILGVTVVLVGIDIIFTFIVQIGSLGAGYSLLDALVFVLLRLPTDLYLMLPVSAFLGTLVGLGSLASKSELIAMQAAGVSIYQISRGVLLAASFLLVFAYLLSTYISPYTRHLAYLKQNQQSNPQALLVLATATWLKSGDHFVYIGQTRPSGNLLNLVSFTIDNNQLNEVKMAQSAQIENDQWTLTGVSDTKISDNQVIQTTANRLTEPSLISPHLLQIISMDPQDMTLPSLYSYIEYRKQNALDIKPYKLQFWSRIFQPLSLVVLMLMAVPFVFGPLRSANNGLRVVVGVFAGFAFYIANQFFSSFSLLFPIPSFLGAAAPIMLFSLILFIMMQRIN